MVDPTGFAAGRFAGFGNDIYTTTNYGFINRSSKGNDVSTTQTYRKKREGKYGNDEATSQTYRKNREDRYGNDEYTIVSKDYIYKTISAYAKYKDPKMAMDILYFDINNTDENAVIYSHYFAGYKGKLVVRHNLFDGASFAIGGRMYINRGLKPGRSSSVDTVKHERGHLVQEDMLGGWDYILKIAIPSITHQDEWDEYFSNPWERGTDFLGGVTGRKMSNGDNYKYKTTAQDALKYMQIGR